MFALRVKKNDVYKLSNYQQCLKKMNSFHARKGDMAPCGLTRPGFVNFLETRCGPRGEINNSDLYLKMADVGFTIFMLSICILILLDLILTKKI